MSAHGRAARARVLAEKFLALRRLTRGLREARQRVGAQASRHLGGQRALSEAIFGGFARVAAESRG